MKYFAFAAIAAACLIAAPADAYTRHSHSHASHSYYRSVDGYRVHGPDYNVHHISAHCADGTFSHSRHSQGTCSHHGGVS